MKTSQTYRCVGFLPKKFYLERRIRGRADQSGVRRSAWMRYQGDVDVVISVCTSVQQFDLAAAALFRRGSEEHDLAPSGMFLRNASSRQSSCQGAHCNEVVSAGVADS